MNRRATPETAHALIALFDRKGTLFEDNAPEELVTLCRRLESERDEAREDRDQYKGLLIRLYNDLFIIHNGVAIADLKKEFREENYN